MSDNIPYFGTGVKKLSDLKGIGSFVCCLFGSSGNGKSSLINTLYSLQFGSSRIVADVRDVGESQQKTVEFKEYPFSRNGSVSVYDTWGFNHGEGRNYFKNEFDDMLDGKMEDKAHHEKAKTGRVEMSRVVNVVVFVFSSDFITRPVLKSVKPFVDLAREKGKKVVVVVTNIDKWAKKNLGNNRRNYNIVDEDPQDIYEKITSRDEWLYGILQPIQLAFKGKDKENKAYPNIEVFPIVNYIGPTGRNYKVYTALAEVFVTELTREFHYDEDDDVDNGGDGPIENPTKDFVDVLFQGEDVVRFSYYESTSKPPTAIHKMKESEVNPVFPARVRDETSNYVITKIFFRYLMLQYYKMRFFAFRSLMCPQAVIMGLSYISGKNVHYFQARSDSEDIWKKLEVGFSTTDGCVYEFVQDYSSTNTIRTPHFEVGQTKMIHLVLFGGLHLIFHAQQNVPGFVRLVENDIQKIKCQSVPPELVRDFEELILENEERKKEVQTFTKKAKGMESKYKEVEGRLEEMGETDQWLSNQLEEANDKIDKENKEVKRMNEEYNARLNNMMRLVKQTQEAMKKMKIEMKKERADMLQNMEVQRRLYVGYHQITQTSSTSDAHTGNFVDFHSRIENNACGMTQNTGVSYNGYVLPRGVYLVMWKSTHNRGGGDHYIELRRNGARLDRSYRASCQNNGQRFQSPVINYVVDMNGSQYLQFYVSSNFYGNRLYNSLEIIRLHDPSRDVFDQFGELSAWISSATYNGNNGHHCRWTFHRNSSVIRESGTNYRYYMDPGKYLIMAKMTLNAGTNTYIDLRRDGVTLQRVYGSCCRVRSFNLTKIVDMTANNYLEFYSSTANSFYNSTCNQLEVIKIQNHAGVCRMGRMGRQVISASMSGSNGNFIKWAPNQNGCGLRLEGANQYFLNQGTYLILWSSNRCMNSTSQNHAMKLRRTGIEIDRSCYSSCGNTHNTLVINKVVRMNGTTDYLQFQCNSHNSGTFHHNLEIIRL